MAQKPGGLADDNVSSSAKGPQLLTINSALRNNSSVIMSQSPMFARSASILIHQNEFKQKKEQTSLIQDYMQALVKFIPVSVLTYLSDSDLRNTKLNHSISPRLGQASHLRQEKERALPECQELGRTCVLVAEMKNFYDTPLNKKVIASASSEHQTNEDLANASDRFLGIMSKSIHKYGGDVIQYLGNSLVAVWYPFKEKASKDDDAQDPSFKEVEISRKAIQCAIDIRAEGHKASNSVDQSEISFGIGFGDTGLLHVGGVLNRVEYCLVGEALSQALTALRLASKRIPIVISPELSDLVQPYFILEEVVNEAIPTEERESAEHIDQASDQSLPFKLVKGLQGAGIRSKVNTLIYRSQIDPDRLKEIQVELKSYIPAAFRPYIKLKNDHAGNEHRRITTMVLNIEVNYQMGDHYSLILIQKLITLIQQQVYRMEGSLNKIISYDNGFTILACWGICPYSHDDDSARAVFAAQNIRRKLNRLAKAFSGIPFEIPLHIGISTGSCFMGIIGNDGGRKEIVILGEAIERAFLFMQAAMRVYGKTFVDYETKCESSQFIEYQFVEHVEFSTKLLNSAIFEPEPNSHLASAMNGADLIKLIRLHANPFELDYFNQYQHGYTRMYGMRPESSVIDQMYEDIKKYITKPDDAAWILAVKGAPGSGKSLFARNLLQAVNSKEMAICRERNSLLEKEATDRYAQRIQLKYVVSSCNAELAKKFLGMWIPVIREIMSQMTIKKGTKVEYILNRMIHESRVSDKVHLIEDIFGVKGLLRDDQAQVMIAEDHASFIKVQAYSREVEEDLLTFLHEFVRDFITQFKNELCFMVILDNASLMDRASWEFFFMLYQDCPQLILIICLQSNTSSSIARGTSPTSNGRLMSQLNFSIAPQAYDYYLEVIGPYEIDIFNIYEVEPLGVYDLRQMLIDLAIDYKHEMQAEIGELTKIINRDKTLKTFSIQAELTRRLEGHFQVSDHFVEVEKEMIQSVIQKCGGNPLMCLNFIYRLITNDFLHVRERILLSTQRLRNAIKTKSWNEISLTPMAIKASCKLIESLYHAKGGFNKLTTDKFVNAFQILKVAAVIGDIFTKRQILYISESLTDQQLHAEDTEEILNELEARGLIELVYEDNRAGDHFFRFQHAFLRETIFQMQIFEGQRRLTHRKIIAYLQENTLYNWQTDLSYEKEYLHFLQHMMIEQRVDKEKDLPFKARQALVIKKVNLALAQGMDIIKQGEMQMLKDKPNTSYKIRYLVLTAKQLIWYRDLTEFKKKNQKGAINMDQLTKVEQDESNLEPDDQPLPKVAGKKFVNTQVVKQFLFTCQCNEFFKGYKLKKSPKTLVLNLNSFRDGEDWIAHIDYLKTKAQLDHFQQQYGTFKIPTQNASQQAIIASQSVKQLNYLTFGQKLQQKITSSLYENVLQPAHARHRRDQSLVTHSSSKISGLKKRVTLMISQDENETVPEPVQKLKNQINNLYALFNMKFLSHLEVNTCKLRHPQDEEFDFVPIASLDRSSIIQVCGEDGVSVLNHITPFVHLRKKLVCRVEGDSDDDEELHDRDSKEGDSFYNLPSALPRRIPRFIDESYDLHQKKGSSFFSGVTPNDDAQRKMTGTFNNLEFLQNHNKEDSLQVINKQNEGLRSSLKGNRSLNVGNLAEQVKFRRSSIMGAAQIDLIANEIQEVQSIHSFANEEITLRERLVAEEKGPQEIKKVLLPLYLKPFIDGEEVTLFESMSAGVELQPGYLTVTLKRRKSVIAQPTESATKILSISQRQLSIKQLKQRQEQSQALERVLDKAKLIPVNSSNLFGVKRKARAKKPSLVVAQSEAVMQTPQLEQQSLPTQQTEVAPIRKYKSMKSKVRFQNISESSSPTSSYHEHLSFLSIGDNMALEQINKYSSTQPEEVKKLPKKIYKQSPSISRDHSQSLIMDERNEESLDTKLGQIKLQEDSPSQPSKHRRSRPSQNEVDFCNVEDSELSDLQVIAGSEVTAGTSARLSINQFTIREVAGRSSRVPVEATLKTEISLPRFLVGQIVYMNQDSQCIVLNHPKTKNVSLKRGQVVKILAAIENLNLYQIEVQVRGELIQAVVQTDFLSEQRVEASSEVESSSFKEEESKLLKQPSDKCIPKALPEFNSFAMGESARPKKHPYHKFMMPVAHDSTIQNEEDQSTIYQEQALGGADTNEQSISEQKVILDIFQSRATLPHTVALSSAQVMREQLKKTLVPANLLLQLQESEQSQKQNSEKLDNASSNQHLTSQMSTLDLLGKGISLKIQERKKKREQQRIREKLESNLLQIIVATEGSEELSFQQ